MVANVKYYVVTIVSIFLAIGIGIFIGFMLNAQDVLSGQREDIISQLETKFDYLKEENEKVKAESQKISERNKKLEEFNEVAYQDMVSGRLEGLKIGIIETNDDYLYSEVNKTLTSAGASVLSSTTIKDLILTDEENLKEIYKTTTGKESTEVVATAIEELTQSIMIGEVTPFITALNDGGYIDISGAYNEDLDYIVMGGGNNEEDDNRYNLIDKTIINIAKKNNISLVGIEKEDVKHSYVDKYKESRVSSIDNVNSTIGRITLVLVMDGNPGNFGTKPNAEGIAPKMDNTSKEQ